MMSSGGWPILAIQLAVAAILGALIDRWYSGARRLENNERFRIIATNIMAFMFLFMTIITDHHKWLGPDVSYRFLWPEFGHGNGKASVFKWVDMLLLVIMLVLPFMASHRISEAKVKRRFLVASVAMFVIVPVWLVLSIVWSMK